MGKTRVTLGLAAAAAEQGRRVLVVDLDPQANATTALGHLTEVEFSANDLLAAMPEAGAAADAIVESAWERVSLLPSELGLARRESDPSAAFEHRLRAGLEGLPGFDLILIDCPPSLGKLTLNALVAATGVLMVADPEAAAVEGLGRLMETVGVVQRFQNSTLEVAGLVVNKVPNPITREAQFRLSEIRQHYAGELWEPMVPYRAAISEAYGAHVPLRQLGTPAALAVADVFSALALRLMPQEVTA